MIRSGWNDDPRAAVRQIWFMLAKKREAAGDHEGARQARRSAHALPTHREMRRYIPWRYE